jgi:hypothetical protein
MVDRKVCVDTMENKALVGTKKMVTSYQQVVVVAHTE